MSTSVDVSFQPSIANLPDANTIRELLQQVPRVTSVRQTARLTGGFGASRIYLAQITAGAGAHGSWILKVGPTSDLALEYEGYHHGKVAVHADNIVTALHFLKGANESLLVYDYVHSEGPGPKDLDWVLSSVDAELALKAVLGVVDSWTSTPSWQEINLGEQLRAWVLDKTAQLPPFILESQGYSAINCPDFAHPFSNPIYHITRTLPRRVGRFPSSFTHGDLNLRNVLFPSNSVNKPIVDRPKFIDFRFAGDQLAVVDYAKLEACLRYGSIRELRDQTDLAQTVAFLYNSSQGLTLEHPPEILHGNSELLARWRLLQEVRRSALRLLKNEETAACYWTALMSYALTFCTYEGVSAAAKRLIYIDAAAIFTRIFKPVDMKGRQLLMQVDPQLSTAIDFEPATAKAAALSAMLGRSISEQRCILFVGSYWGRTSGVEGLPLFFQRLHKDLGSDAPPSSSTRVLLESLSRRHPRRRISQAVKERLVKWSMPDDAEATFKHPWAAVISGHYHSFSRKRLLEQHPKLTRIDSAQTLAQHIEDGSEDSLLYFPLFADDESTPETSVLSPRDYQLRLDLVRQLSAEVQRRHRPLSLLFWKCEELPEDLLMEFRDALASGTTSPVDIYYITDTDDNIRDATLDAIGIGRIRGLMSDVPVSETVLEEISIWGSRWRRGDVVVNLPDVGRLSKGLLEMFDTLGRLVSISAASGPEEFLLGAPVSRDDIAAGRVVKRRVVGEEIVPAIQSAFVSKRESIRVVTVYGRAGAGVSTALCYAAHMIASLEMAPILVAARTAGYRRQEWQDAGRLCAEISQLAKRPAVVFIEVVEDPDGQLEAFAEGVAERRGEVVVVIGGRTDVVAGIKAKFNLNNDRHVQVRDEIDDDEATALATILHDNGYSLHLGKHELASRIKRSEVLLPAIYEATDKKNRKFKEIVAYEYHCYDREQSTQKAYRMICLLGALGRKINQYWLLKSIGTTSVHDAAFIFDRLSGDIVKEHEQTPAREQAADAKAAKEGHSVQLEPDLLFGPRHRLIATEVLEIAYADPEHRLIDLRTLIRAANMASRQEGGTVAALLVRKSPLMEWMKEQFGGRPEALFSESANLYEEAINNVPIAPIVEIILRQHYALLHRWHYHYDEAIAQAEAAFRIDPENTASIHVLGLAHDARAIDAWKRVARNPEDREAIAKAFADEREARTFFKQSRLVQPRQEYGYESEARYLRKRHDALNVLNVGGMSPTVHDLVREATRGLYVALELLREAAARVPEHEQKESGPTRAIVLAKIGNVKDALLIVESELTSIKADPIRRIGVLRVAATLAAEAKMWEECRGYLTRAISEGEHGAATYLLLDEALEHLGLSDERIRYLRQSAEEWNTEDVDTLVRWAGICLEARDWDRAVRSLRIADDVGRRQRMSHFERERVCGRIRTKGLGQSALVRFVGVVERLFRGFDGQVKVEGAGISIYFRVEDDISGSLEIGTRLSFGVAWRVAGIRAIGVRVEPLPPKA
jgi:tetratricopeptide (TPR) repeat protein